MNEGLAEFYGAMIGDGCLSRYFSNYHQKEIFCVLMTGHTHDEPYYRKTLRPILLSNFGLKGCIRFRKKDNVVRFETSGKKVFSFFQNQGFPIGLKSKLFFPKAILNSNRFSIAGVRGVFDTDGSVYRRYSKKYKNHARLYNYKVIQIKMNSFTILHQIKSILNRNKISSNRIIQDNKSFVLRITHQNDIKCFMQIFKPNNIYHTERYLN